jgi:uncharacterized membrane protein required for colicin V production
MKKLYFSLLCCVFVSILFYLYIASPLEESLKNNLNSVNTATIALIFFIAIYPVGRCIGAVISWLASLFGNQQKLPI